MSTTILRDDLLHGAQAIADYIGIPLRKAYYLIGRRAIPVRRLGKRAIIARRSEIDAALRALPRDDDDGLM